MFKTSRSDTEFMLQVGSVMWEEIYKNSGDADAWNKFIIKRERLRLAAIAENKEPDSFMTNTLSAVKMFWSIKWVDGGCRTIMSDEKYFCAMAQTKCEIAEELNLPWPAFMMKMPSGLFIDEEDHEYVAAYFGQFEGVRGSEEPNIVSAFYAIATEDGRCFMEHKMGCSLIDLLCKTSPALDHETKSQYRIRDLIRRAAAGLLYTMQHTKNWRFERSYFSRAGNRTKLRNAPPPHRVIFIGRPLAIDLVDAVRSDARTGAHNSPSVQTLVRGHIKRQVVGTGRSDRKIIWIEPYWRGPEDAPILARPYLVSKEASEV